MMNLAYESIGLNGLTTMENIYLLKDNENNNEL